MRTFRSYGSHRLLVLVSIFADGLAPYRFEEIHLRDRLQAPSAAYLLGADHVGRDLLSRLIHGARLSLTVGWPPPRSPSWWRC